MTKVKQEFICPKCNKKNRIKIHDDITDEEIEKVINRELFSYHCKNCNESLIIEYPLKITGSNYCIYYTPTKTDSIDDNCKEYMRICDTYNDLKEKILIFQEDLNDIVIEFIKRFLLTQLDVETQKNTREIRFNNIYNDTITFSLIGENKTIGCSMDFYNKIQKKLKIKKIDKCVLIDENTFDKYYKMRLL